MSQLGSFHLLATASKTVEQTPEQYWSFSPLPGPSPESIPKKVFAGLKIKGTKALGLLGIDFIDAALNWPGRDFTGAKASQQRFVRMPSTWDTIGGASAVKLERVDWIIAIA